MRKVKRGEVNRTALDVISKNYNKLKQLCGCSNRGCYCSKSYEDIFQNTILYVIHDKESFMLDGEDEYIQHFIYRFKMIEFQTINDNKLLKEVMYADHFQAKKNNREED